MTFSEIKENIAQAKKSFDNIDCEFKNKQTYKNGFNAVYCQNTKQKTTRNPGYLCEIKHCPFME